MPETAEAQAKVDFWRRRQSSPNYMLYYEHGKSAVRCDTDGRYVPPTVHLFMPRTPTGDWDQV